MKLKIKIMDKEEIDMEIDKALDKAEGGLIKEENVIYLTPKQVSQVFTPKRAELLHYLAEKKPSSVAEITKELGRDWKSVIRDLKYLEGFGLIKLKKVKKHRIPELLYKESVMAFG
jgi:predicted transcriptional regulator